MKNGIDKYIAEKDPAGLGQTVLWFLGVVIAALAIRYLYVYLTAWIGERVVLDLRIQLYDHLQRLKVGTIDSRPVGWWMTRITDVQTLNEMFSTAVVSIFGDLLALLGILVILLWMNYKLALITFIVLPLLIMVVATFRKAVQVQYRVIREAIARLNGFVQEHITGVRTVQLFGREKPSVEEFSSHNAYYRSAYIKTIRYYALFFPAISFLAVLATTLIFLSGGLMIRAGTLSWGALTAFIQYSERFFRPIRDLSEHYNVMQAAMTAAERVFWLLDLEIEPTRKTVIGSQATQTALREEGRSAETNRKTGGIEFDRVNFSYLDGEPILHEVSFTVEPGSMVAVVGATGAGKSTLISLLLRYWEAGSGTIRVDGIDVTRRPLHELRQRFGLVMQDTYLFSGSIAENVSLGDPAREGEVLRDALRRAGALTFVEKLAQGVDEPVGERGARLSGGEKQLLSIARALAADPPILLLDEATASVDTETERQIQAALEQLMANRTTLVVAHRLSTIVKADKIIVMHKGSVAEMGTHEELLALNGLYAKLYRLQFAEAA
jgi:ATP-binding cassette subfamily B protein